MCGMICMKYCDLSYPCSGPARFTCEAVPPPPPLQTGAMPPPSCHICSYRQPVPEKPMKVFHLHHSSREVRVTMGVEGHRDNPFYMCPSCQAPHPARLKHGLNVCVSTSQLHNFHFPRDDSVVVAPDSLHVDWITIPGGTVKQLIYAWRLDYHREERPQRLVLVAGLNDLLKGGNAEQLKESILDFEDQVKHQNRYHLKRNEFYVAPLIIPPKLGWFLDNGPMPDGYINRLDEMRDINNWIREFNAKNNIQGIMPNFQAWGNRTWRDRAGGFRQTHRWNDWRSTEAVNDKLHLKDSLRAKMGRAVVRFFQGELDRKGPLV